MHNLYLTGNMTNLQVLKVSMKFLLHTASGIRNNTATVLELKNLSV